MRITNFRGQLLIKKKEYEQLVRNHMTWNITDNFDPKPVIKLFTPDAWATWLITEINHATRIMFWLCDLWVWEPELWYVSLDELLELKGVLGLPVERDKHIKLEFPLSYYTDKACENWEIIF